LADRMIDGPENGIGSAPGPSSFSKSNRKMRWASVRKWSS
jgi:hypothetical protein